ncbi:Pimeloyl-ACP methyl ester carboxylesterase [Paracoccus alcaliphilus]|uniref:Pimeloyl-ACP methyl ester carboxylesterase n=1 Tax=Paracoccus alcaliphilus TaxID=34002 RepID=A0A1H8NAQ3_9RHOB|nr:alpha/beta hydrolase [Paracoccus alcaliphilus]WCR18042.1 alpha/beta hydrolase [Paracoccus alcaliphilus]SEO26503.1 Pimeloyl-ACP methyl ester carboxylesterase [Paracoccus alcaliphilus]
MSGQIHQRHWPGDPDRPALALHCMLGSAGYWGPIATRLKGRVDLSGFDMPGHGRSDAWHPGPDSPDYHTTVTRIAASYIQRPLDLIGHSMGATVALRIAVAAPDAVRSLTLIEPVLFAAAPHPAQSALDAEMLTHLNDGREAEAARLFLSVWGHYGYDEMPHPIQKQMRDLIPLVTRTNDALNHDSANILRDGGLEAIDAPVLMISGAQSPPVISDIAEALAARLPDVGRATVPDAAHMLPITHPAAVAELIALNLDRA